tara:strand:+ start:1810 stop:1980 length:171 start_codon:yes stop_codon:yes gene_type:complete
MDRQAPAKLGSSPIFSISLVLNPKQREGGQCLMLGIETRSLERREKEASIFLCLKK